MLRGSIVMRAKIIAVRKYMCVMIRDDATIRDNTKYDVDPCYRFRSLLPVV